MDPIVRRPYAEFNSLINLKFEADSKYAHTLLSPKTCPHIYFFFYSHVMHDDQALGIPSENTAKSGVAKRRSSCGPDEQCAI